MKWLPLGFLVLVLLVPSIAACGQVPTEPPAAGQPTPLPKVPPWPPEAQPLVDLAITDAAKQANVSPASVEVVRVQPVQWPNGCLGCAKKGQICTDVVVPGYRIILRAAGQEYDYHTDMKDAVLLCATEPPVGDWGPAQPLVDAVVADLANRLGVDKSQIAVVEVKEKNWPDSSIGCPQPGQMYLQVITPGYQIILQAGGKQYDYHTGSQSRFILCEK